LTLDESTFRAKFRQDLGENKINPKQLNLDFLNEKKASINKIQKKL